VTAARIAQLRADLADALQRRADLELRWAVATHTASGSDRPEDLDVELVRADAAIVVAQEALAAAEPAQSEQTAADAAPAEGPAKAPGLTQDRLSGAGGYRTSYAPAPAHPGATPNREPEYLTTREAAALLRTSTDTLERMRARGDGPPWRRVGRRVLYPRVELLAYGGRYPR
jgi:excisionase family DNA binding protein